MGSVSNVADDNNGAVSIHPRDSPTSCLQVASKDLDATVSIGPCASPPSIHQQWVFRSTPPTPSVGNKVGTCVRTDRGGTGTCLFLSSDGTWSLDGASHSTGKVSKDVTREWTRLGIAVKGNIATAIIDGKPQPALQTLVGAAAGSGMVSLNSGYNVAYFDNFEVTESVSDVMFL